MPIAISALPSAKAFKSKVLPFPLTSPLIKAGRTPKVQEVQPLFQRAVLLEVLLVP